MRRTKNVLWALLFVVLAVPVHAQTPFRFVNGGSVSAFGYLVGPYNGQMGDGYSQSVILNCVDFFHHVSNGQTWLANITQLSPGADLTSTRFGGMTDALTLYQQAAWLTTQYAGKTAQQIGDIQATIWHLFGDAFGMPNATSSYWLTQAQLNYQTLDFSNFAVVTDVNKASANSVQEFLIYKPVVTPEPVTMMLLGTGLVGLAPLARRRRRQQEQADQGDDLA